MRTVAFPHTRILSVLVVIALAIVSSAPAFAQRVNGVGGACTKAGATSKVGTTMLKCDKVNKKLVWVSMGGTTNSKQLQIPRQLQQSPRRLGQLPQQETFS